MVLSVRVHSAAVIFCCLLIGLQTKAIPVEVDSVMKTFALPLFDPSRSSSANVQLSHPLRVNYADANTELSGVLCRDDVRLGEYAGRISFACLTTAPDQQFWARMGNGVLGLAPRYQKQQDEDNNPLPVAQFALFRALHDTHSSSRPPAHTFFLDVHVRPRDR